MPLSKSSLCDIAKLYAGSKQENTFSNVRILALVTLVSH